MDLARQHFLETVEEAFEVHPVVALLGPRQCGKTTLARKYKAHFEKKVPFTYFDLEDPRHLARLEFPMLALEELEGVIVIDEIQRSPELFPVLRVLESISELKSFVFSPLLDFDNLIQVASNLRSQISLKKA